MLNEPSNQTPKPVHPLARPPANHHGDGEQPPSQRVMLHIRTVKPYVTWALIAINIVIYLLGLISPEIERNLFVYGVNNQRAVLLDGEYMRMFSSMFLHGNLAHIFFNMYSLYAIGSNLEALFGHVRFAVIYFLGGLTGSLASVILNSPNVYSVGASGAVFAILGAEMVYLYKHRKLYRQVATERLRSLFIILAMNLAIGFLGNSTGGGSIDNWAHLGGLVGGVGLSWLFGPVFLLRKHPDHDHDRVFLAEDVNPLPERYPQIMLYIAGLLSVLIAASLLMR